MCGSGGRSLCGIEVAWRWRLHNVAHAWRAVCSACCAPSKVDRKRAPGIDVALVVSLVEQWMGKGRPPVRAPPAARGATHGVAGDAMSPGWYLRVSHGSASLRGCTEPRGGRDTV